MIHTIAISILIGTTLFGFVAFNLICYFLEKDYQENELFLEKLKKEEWRDQTLWMIKNNL
jgi:anaerobic C4-dicarboxylate transporter